jgi:hypothetical protein
MLVSSMLWVLAAAAASGPATTRAASGPAVDPTRAADELRATLLRQGPFRAVYEVAQPARQKSMTIEITADLPAACASVTKSGTEEVRAYVDARRRAFYILGPERGRTTLARTDAAPLVEAVRGVRSVFLRLGLGEEAGLPDLGWPAGGVRPQTGTDGVFRSPASRPAADDLHLFATLTLGPALDPQGQPYVKTGAGLAVGFLVQCGSWLAEFVPAARGSLSETAETYLLADQLGTQLAVSRRTGLPVSAQVRPTPDAPIVMTLKSFEALREMPAPTWALTPEAGVEVRDVPMPEQQRRVATYTALVFYAGRVIRHAEEMPTWRERLAAQREAAVEAFRPHAAAIWQDHGRGVERKLTVVLAGAFDEARRRFAYVKETDAAKRREIAGTYAEEALARRQEVIDEGFDALLGQFARDLPRRSAATSRPAEAAVQADLLALLREAARRGFRAQITETIVDELLSPSPKP